MVVTMKELDFGTWMGKIDDACWYIAGCGVHDLPDCCFADWHDQGMAAGTAARKAIRAAKDEEE